MGLKVGIAGALWAGDCGVTMSEMRELPSKRSEEARDGEMRQVAGRSARVVGRAVRGHGESVKQTRRVGSSPAAPKQGRGLPQDGARRLDAPRLGSQQRKTGRRAWAVGGAKMEGRGACAMGVRAALRGSAGRLPPCSWARPSTTHRSPASRSSRRCRSAPAYSSSRPASRRCIVPPDRPRGPAARTRSTSRGRAAPPPRRQCSAPEYPARQPSSRPSCPRSHRFRALSARGLASLAHRQSAEKREQSHASGGPRRGPW